jgi:anthranilate phosphoribosyltransferase
VLQRLGSRHVLVVHGVSGLDEIALDGETMVGELKDGSVREYVIRPGDFGIPEHELGALKVADAADSRDRVIQALDGVPGPVLDVVLLNAGAALYAADVEPSIAAGIERARRAVVSGAARAKLDQFVTFTRAV